MSVAEANAGAGANAGAEMLQNASTLKSEERRESLTF